MLSTLKLKLIAAGSVIMIGLLAALKWLYVSNKAKKAKIKELKLEAKIARTISKMDKDVSEFHGSQEAIKKDDKRLEKNTELEASKIEKAEKDGKTFINTYTDVTY